DLPAELLVAEHPAEYPAGRGRDRAGQVTPEAVGRQLLLLPVPGLLPIAGLLPVPGNALWYAGLERQEPLRQPADLGADLPAELLVAEHSAEHPAGRGCDRSGQ